MCAQNLLMGLKVTHLRLVLFLCVWKYVLCFFVRVKVPYLRFVLFCAYKSAFCAFLCFFWCVWKSLICVLLFFVRVKVFCNKKEKKIEITLIPSIYTTTNFQSSITWIILSAVVCLFPKKVATSYASFQKYYNYFYSILADIYSFNGTLHFFGVETCLHPFLPTYFLLMESSYALREALIVLKLEESL